MALGPGSRIGPYEVAALIGEGGMGKVWRARHTALKRDDALKVLPDAFASDPDRLSRFRREAQFLASLNHPNIAHVYGLEQADGVQALVMELVEGPTLADRIAQGSIPVDEALPIAKQIAEALEAAHEQSIIHRDLKPANIKLREDGVVKVLDFGLAKALEPMLAGGMDGAAAPTIRSPAMMTDAGVLLGTAAYMSPEQARGKAADKRSDIWAFGCVLYEMLTAQPAFSRETVSDTLAAVLTEEPDWHSLLPETPPYLKRLLRRCLERNPSRRWQHVGDVRIELLDSTVLETAGTTARSAARRRGPILVIACALLLALVVAESILLWRSLTPAESRPLTRFAIGSAAGVAVAVNSQFSSSVAISADGRRIVFVGEDRGGVSRLYARSMDNLEVTPIVGSEGASGPFVSPDGAWVAFFAEGRLQKVAVRGGPPLVLDDTAPRLIGGAGAWLPDETIVFSFTNELFRVSATGGTAEAVTKRNPNEEGAHVWPDGLSADSVLFTIRGEGASNQIAVQSLRTGERKILIEDGANARYLPTGHVVYARSGSLMAVPFDKDRMELLGSPFPVLDDLATDGTVGLGHYAISNTGSLIYVKGTAGALDQGQLVWVDRQGVQQPVPLTPRGFGQPRLSPDGTQAAFRVFDSNIDVWIHNLVRGSVTRLTSHNDEDETPIWAPDGKLVAFASDRGIPKRFIHTQPPDGSANERPITELTGFVHLSSWSPDGNTIAYTHYDAETGGDIGTITIGEPQPKSFLKTQFNEHSGSFSPNGRWIAYVSNESGQDEIYVVSYPGPGGRWQVSSNGGNEPVWSRDGKELFYRSADKMMVVLVSVGATFSASSPKQLFEAPFFKDHRNDVNYDVSPDGQRFLMIRRVDESNEAPANEIILVENWLEELKRLVPVD